MSKLLIFLSLTLLIFALESNAANFTPFGIHQKRDHFVDRKFVHPRMRVKMLKKLTKNHQKMKYEEELQKLMTDQPKIKSLQAFWLSEAQKMIDYMTIRKI